MEITNYTDPCLYEAQLEVERLIEDTRWEHPHEILITMPVALDDEEVPEDRYNVRLTYWQGCMVEFSGQIVFPPKGDAVLLMNDLSANVVGTADEQS
jgi:hypothetical protein